ncbi:MAG: hypothetical protein RIF41_35380 [Polyangiaceae bacterium]
MTLVVGQNATGKTRCLNVIKALAQLFLQQRQIGNGHWVTEFEDGDRRLSYEVQIEDSRVLKETLSADGELLLSRDAEGSGTICSRDLGQDLKLGLSPEQVAAVVKRDRVHHPFLEPLATWAEGVRHYLFGERMGRTTLLVVSPDEGPELDLTNADHVAAVFRRATEKHGDDYKAAVLEDMSIVGYNLEDIEVGPLEGLKLSQPVPGKVEGFRLKEADLVHPVQHHSISAGMFRALSLVVHINYALRDQSASCILIDDNGEGLDYDRSSNLIKLLVDRVEHSNLQLVMSTNDRFVMNAVSLDKWAILTRDGIDCRVMTKTTHPKEFEDFEFTGLSNFDFLASEFWKKALAEEKSV